jgi:hypothetical protein
VKLENDELDPMVVPMSIFVVKSVKVKYLGFYRPLVTTKDSAYDRFCPVANGWRTIHPMPEKAPPLQAEDEGP